MISLKTEKHKKKMYICSSNVSDSEPHYHSNSMGNVCIFINLHTF